jgi:hypothetical protein
MVSISGTEVIKEFSFLKQTVNIQQLLHQSGFAETVPEDGICRGDFIYKRDQG